MTGVNNMNEFELGTGFPLYYSYGRRRQRMSLITAIKGPNSIIVAADSRMIEIPEYRYRDDFKKVYEIGGCLLGCAGLGGYGAFLLDGFKKNPQSELRYDVHSLALDIAGSFLRDYRKMFPSDQKKPEWNLAFLLAGYKNSEKGNPVPALYTLYHESDFTPSEVVYDEFVCIGQMNKAYFIIGNNMEKLTNRGATIAISKFAIEQTARSFISVGGPIKLMEINPQNECLEIPEDDIESAVILNPESQWNPW
jgi:20S proteasome alpha/beta subunit